MKRSLFKKLIGVCLAVAVAVGGVATCDVTEAQAKLKESKHGGIWFGSTVHPRDYDDRTEYLIDRVTVGGRSDIYSKAEVISVSDLMEDQLSRETMRHDYANTDFSRYESILCAIRTDYYPEQLFAFAIGYLPDGTPEIIYKDTGYDIMGFDRDGWNRAGFNWQGWDREGYDYDGYDAKGYDRTGYNENGCPNFTAPDKDGWNYWYYEEDVKPFSWTKHKYFVNSAAQFEKAKPGLYYKVTITGLKNSKYVTPKMIRKDSFGEYSYGFEGFNDDWCASDNRYITDKYGYWFSCVPVKNGKVTFYTQSSCGINNARIDWEYEKNESGETISVTPITKEQLKKETTISVKSKLVITSGTKPSYVTLTANEPVHLIAYGRNSGRSEYMLDNEIYCEVNKKIGKVKFGWAGFNRHVGGRLANGTLTLKGAYSGKVVKIKVINKSPYSE